MLTFSSISEVLDYAICREDDAARFYTDLAGKMERKEMRDIFIEFAEEERSHSDALTALRDKGRTSFPEGYTVTLDIEDDDEEDRIVPSADMSYCDALKLAIAREMASIKLYTALGEDAAGPEQKRLFETLVQEEVRHKLRFELDYDACS